MELFETLAPVPRSKGFQSIGPFNRGFKAETRRTPTEFRRDAMAGSQTVGLQKNNTFEIGQSGREFG
jgi:AraC-like DNA-binding protein